MRINYNVASVVTQGALENGNRATVKNLEKLSTGLRINRASDDAAGLAISEKLRTQVRGSEQAKRNALDGISAMNIAEGAANEISNILQRQRELAIQASTATYSNAEREYLDLEYQQLTSEIARICSSTNFNGMKLLDPAAEAAGTRFGSTANCELWIDANSVNFVDSISASYTAIDVSTLSIGNVSTQSTAQAEIGALDKAITMVSKMRADIGSYVNRLESTINNLNVSIANQGAAESQIRDTDFALESSNFTRNQIITQSATAMLSQANQVPQSVLQLVRG
ncbi:MAG: flagellin [Chitinivibrionia bacterium]|nr:flagellin [Chitinivibrionia bacterium]